MASSARRQLLDQKLSPLHDRIPITPKGGWISAVRGALCMTTKQLGKRVGVSQSAISELERSENERTITLKSLDRVADAMNCEVRYTFIPRDSLLKTVLRQAEKVYALERKSISRTMALEDQEVPATDTLESIELAMYLFKNEKRIWD